MLMKELAKHIKQYKRATILTPIFTAGEVVLEVAIPLVLAKLIDYGIEMGNMSAIYYYGAILVAIALLSLVCGVVAARVSAVASTGFAANLRRAEYARVQEFSFANIDKFSTAGIITRLTTDVSNVQMAFMMVIRIAVRVPLMLIFALTMAISIHAKLALVFVAIVPILAVGLFAIIRNVHPIFERGFKKYDKLNNVVQENIRGIRVVKAFVREEHEIDKFNQASQGIFNDFTKAERLLAFNSPIMQFAVYTAMILLSWFGAKFIVIGSLSTGELMSMFSYTMQILSSLMMLSMIFVMLTMSKASVERINEIFQEEIDLTDKPNGETVVKDGSVVFENVGFSYQNSKEKECLRKIDFTIDAGETIGIIGATGSGKSSLVQLIPRLYDVLEGRVLVGGIDVRDYRIESLRDQVAMVLQKNVLFSGTIKENLRWGNENATDEELIRAAKLAQADEFIAKMPQGYDTFIEQGGSNVSGGQRQRLCIARALVKKPKILILDDSTSAVDTKTDSLIRQAFLEEIPETTKIIIGQRISSVKDADRIVVMENGEIDAIGTHDELLASNAIYQEVYYSQSKEGDFDAKE